MFLLKLTEVNESTLLCFTCLDQMDQTLHDFVGFVKLKKVSAALCMLAYEEMCLLYPCASCEPCNHTVLHMLRGLGRTQTASWKTLYGSIYCTLKVFR